MTPTTSPSATPSPSVSPAPTQTPQTTPKPATAVKTVVRKPTSTPAPAPACNIAQRDQVGADAKARITVIEQEHANVIKAINESYPAGVEGLATQRQQLLDQEVARYSEAIKASNRLTYDKMVAIHCQ